MKKVLDRVVELLKSNADLRDDVVLTRKKIWEEDLMNTGKSLHFIYGSELIDMEQKGELTNSETIRRMWQIAQQKNPELRGKQYEARRGKKQQEVKSEIKEIRRDSAIETEAEGFPNNNQQTLSAA